MGAIKQILAGIIVGVFLLTAGLAGYFYFNQEKIVEILIKEVNKQINTQIDVKEVSMSFFERFPYVSVKFDQVTVHGSRKNDQMPKDTLVTAQNIYFDLDIKTLISDKPQIKRLAISNGKIQMALSEEGSANYEIFKNKPSSRTNKKGSLKINAIEIQNIQFIYNDRQQNQYYTGQIEQALIQGVIEDRFWQLNTDITVVHTNLIPHKYNYFQQYRWSGDVNKTQGLLELKGLLQADNYKLNVEAVYNLKNNQAVVQSSGLTLDDEIINKLLAQHNIKNINLKTGKTKITQIRYNHKGKNSQYLSLGFKSNHSVVVKEKGLTLDTHGRLNYSNGNTFFKINTAEIGYKGSSAYFEGSYSYPSQTIKGFTSFTLNLDDLNETQTAKLPVRNLTGLIDGQAQIKGKVNEKISYDNIFREGELGFENVGLVIRDNDFQIENLKALLKISPENIVIDSLNGTFNQNTLSFHGQIDNLFEYLRKEKPISINGKAQTQNFNLSTFLLISENTKSSEPFRLTDDIRLDLTFDANKLTQNNFSAKNIKTHFRKYGRRIELLNLQMQTNDGNISTKGKLLQQKNNEWYVELSGDLQNVDVSGIFKAFNNFGQNYITAKNLSGRLTADVQADFVFHPDFSIRPESLYLITNLKIEDGALIDYKTLQALSNYIDVKELEHVKFARLENQISIQNQKIIIPYMEVQSSAIDLGLTGTHTFNNAIDYQISVGLADVLFRKLRRKHQKAQASRQNNKMMVFVDITGTTEDYNIEFSKLKRKRVEPVPQQEQKKKFDIDFGDFK